MVYGVWGFRVVRGFRGFRGFREGFSDGERVGFVEVEDVGNVCDVLTTTVHSLSLSLSIYIYR